MKIIKEARLMRGWSQAKLAELERGVPRVEPDMVRFFLHKLRACDAPDAAVRGFVSCVVIDRDGAMRVEFEVDGLGFTAGSSEAPKNSTKPAGRPTGFESDALVYDSMTRPNRRVFAIPGWFAVAA